MSEKHYQDAQVLYELYVRKGMTQPEVADIFDVSHPTIHYWLDKHDIDARPPKTPNLHAGYCERGSTSDSAGYWGWYSKDPDERVRSMTVHRLLAVAEYGVDAVAGNHVHHKNGVPWDNRPENIEPLSPREHGTRHERKTGEWDDEDYLRKEYEEKRKSAYQIAEENDIACTTVYSRMDEYGIERRAEGRGN